MGERNISSYFWRLKVRVSCDFWPISEHIIDFLAKSVIIELFKESGRLGKAEKTEIRTEKSLDLVSFRGTGEAWPSADS